MHRNGDPQLHVLLSGAASRDLTEALALEPTVSVLRGAPASDQAPAADVALHVISEGGDLAAEIAKLRSYSRAPLILAAYGEPNGIVDAGLKFGAADVVVLPQPAETLLFALRKAAITPAVAAADLPKATVVTVFSPHAPRIGRRPRWCTYRCRLPSTTRFRARI